jgi:lipopolysaccharide/colanic/teichoic acid biosynthesis glycosyltransferase
VRTEARNVRARARQPDERTVQSESSVHVTVLSRGPALLSRPAVHERTPGAFGADDAAQRLLDIVLSGAGLLASLPVSLALAAAIKLEDGGPVFFRQPRIGRGGRAFTALKFRSMVPPSDGPRVPQQGAPDEALITKVGRLMRATALDELPQLWNIFRGDMSFVGPRAVPPVEKAGDGSGEVVKVSELPGFQERHQVRPGLTGLAQVYLRRDATHLQKFRYDLLYVQTRSLALDVQLIARSVWISVRGAWPEIGKRESAG